MRWKPEHQPGDKRIVRKFLWFPLTLPVGYIGDQETRWWEYANIQQYWYDGFSFSAWMNERFMPEQTNDSP
jgi:hypothetical protein